MEPSNPKSGIAWKLGRGQGGEAFPSEGGQKILIFKRALSCGGWGGGVILNFNFLGDW